MTQAAKKIKGQQFSASLENLAALTVAVDEYIAQRNITIVGFELQISGTVPSAATGEDGGYHLAAELTRGSEVGSNSAIARLVADGNWRTGELGRPFEDVHSEMIFPDGYGVDVDDGEPVSLIISGFPDNAAVFTSDYAATCLMLYIDR